MMKKIFKEEESVTDITRSTVGLKICAITAGIKSASQ